MSGVTSRMQKKDATGKDVVRPNCNNVHERMMEKTSHENKQKKEKPAK